jgi:hypothetical protein
VRRSFSEISIITNRGTSPWSNSSIDGETSPDGYSEPVFVPYNDLARTENYFVIIWFHSDHGSTGMKYGFDPTIAVESEWRQLTVKDQK